MTSAPPAATTGPRCWRCGKQPPSAGGACPYCHALPRRQASRVVAAARRGPASPLSLVMVFFGLLLATSLLHGALLGASAGTPRDDVRRARSSMRFMISLEIVDTALVGAALLLIPRPPRRPPLVSARPAWLWAVSAVAMTTVVGVNHLYHRVLGTYLGVSPERDVLLAGGITPLVLVAFCIQPAVVEELFFRYLALDTLRGVMSPTMAVVISSLMFGMAHVGAPLSVPLLALIGVPLALARLASGGLALPMALHFLHNMLILLAS